MLVINFTFEINEWNLYEFILPPFLLTAIVICIFSDSLLMNYYVLPFSQPSELKRLRHLYVEKKCFLFFLFFEKKRNTFTSCRKQKRIYYRGDVKKKGDKISPIYQGITRRTPDERKKGKKKYLNPLLIHIHFRHFGSRLHQATSILVISTAGDVSGG